MFSFLDSMSDRQFKLGFTFLFLALSLMTLFLGRTAYLKYKIEKTIQCYSTDGIIQYSDVAKDLINDSSSLLVYKNIKGEKISINKEFYAICKVVSKE